VAKCLCSFNSRPLVALTLGSHTRSLPHRTSTQHSPIAPCQFYLVGNYDKPWNVTCGNAGHVTSVDYLDTLKRGSKWHKPSANLQVSAIIILREDNLRGWICKYNGSASVGVWR
jgi:hypothetical protein